MPGLKKPKQTTVQYYAKKKASDGSGEDFKQNTPINIDRNGRTLAHTFANVHQEGGDIVTNTNVNKKAENFSNYLQANNKSFTGVNSTSTPTLDKDGRMVKINNQQQGQPGEVFDANKGLTPSAAYAGDANVLLNVRQGLSNDPMYRTKPNDPVNLKLQNTLLNSTAPYWNNIQNNPQAAAQFRAEYGDRYADNVMKSLAPVSPAIANAPIQKNGSKSIKLKQPKRK